MNLPAIPRQFRDAARVAIRRGWKITSTGSGHLKWRSPDGTTIIYTSRTPGGGRSVQNTMAKFKRAGLLDSEE